MTNIRYILEKPTFSSIDQSKTDVQPIWINNKFTPALMGEREGVEFIRYIKNLSKKIESEDLLNFDKKTIEYLRQVDITKKAYGKSLKIYFLINFYKYSIKDFFGILKNSFLKQKRKDSNWMFF